MINGDTNTNMNGQRNRVRDYKNVYSQVVRRVLIFIWRKNYKI